MSDIASLPLTGERTVPGIAEENYWFRRHEVAYVHIANVLRKQAERGLKVLEAGCGEGYGADLLADVVRPNGGSVVGFDYDDHTISHVGAKYSHSVGPLRGDLQRLPVATDSVGLVVNLQVIEHLHDQPGFLRECARVLGPGGRLIVSTPNRITFSPGLDSPINPFHTRELDPAELQELLEPCFEIAHLGGIWHGAAFAAFPDIVDTLIATAPQDWDAELRDFVLAVTADDFDLRFTATTDELNDCLDLFYVATVRS